MNNDIDYDALAEKIASDDYEPGPSWSLLDLSEVRAFELLRREYEAALAANPDAPADGPWASFLIRGRDDAAVHLAAAKTRAGEAGVPNDFIESVVSRDALT